MLVIKYLILFLIFVLSNLIGKAIAKKYTYRLEELKEMKNALNMFKTKIEFTYEPIPEIFSEISKSTSKQTAKIFEMAKFEMENNSAEIAWQNAIEKSENNLKKEDKSTLKILSKMLRKI
jgi:stage III sporulation protein AB